MASNNSYNSRKSRRNNYQPGAEQAIVETILKGLWMLVSLPFRKGKGGARKANLPIAIAQQLASHWPSIEQHLQQESTYSLAVSEADKLFDAALQASGIPGNTMGERLQSAKTRFASSFYQQIWDAHKLRNALAHEVGVGLSRHDAQQAVHTFKTALVQLGVLV